MERIRPYVAGATLAGAAALCLAVPLVAAANWGVVSSCPTPCAEPRGLVGDYLVGDAATPYVYSVSLTSGSVFSSFAAPGGPGAWGITDAGRDGFYLSNNLTSWIYEITTSGSVLSSFKCPLPGPADMGYSWSTRLELTIPDMNVLAIVNPENGSLVATFAGPGLRPTSCAGYRAVFITDVETHKVYHGGRPVIEGIETPTGIFYQEWIDTYPTYDVFIVDGATKHIYFYQDNVAVVPASLGRVRALFK